MTGHCLNLLWLVSQKKHQSMIVVCQNESKIMLHIIK